MSEPVAWQVEFENGEVELWSLADQPNIPAFGVTVTPLYASSYAQGVADAVRVIDDYILMYTGEASVMPLHGVKEALRSLSAPPSVTEEWIMGVEVKVYETGCDPVRATLAALGIEVRSNEPAPEIFPGTMDALNSLGIRK